MDNRDLIEKLARAVAERTPVTWEDELRSVPDDEGRNLVEQLRVVDRIVDTHWSSPGVPERLGDFEIIREIGRGRMGVVYDARQVSLDRHVAVKVLPSELTGDPVRLQRFEREAKTLAAVNHPNIVTIHSVEKIEGVHFITMELVDGQSLLVEIPRGGMPIHRLLDIAIAMADALSSAHNHEIVHRDLKPANIMINAEGRVKILDFGLAKLRDETVGSGETRTATVDIDVTREGIVVGTIPYMSPEQAEARQIDHRSDLFAMGTILYEMATGRRPFAGDSARRVILAVSNETPAPVSAIKPDLPEGLDRIIAHCHRKDPERRYQTAKGLRNELEELKQELERPKLPPRPPRWPSSLAIAVAAMALAALVAVAYFFFPLTGPPTPESARYLAVMPFVNAGEDNPRLDAFTDGLTEILTAKLTGLTQTHDLQVAPADRVRGMSIASIEETLGVDLAVRGTIQLSGNDVRVTINLVDVHDHKLLRAEILDVALSDPFRFQDQIVVAVVDMLDLELPDVEAEALRTHGTTVAAAHELYVQGRGFMRNYEQPENVDRAISAFEQALEKDPNFAQAHAGLGMACWKRFEHAKDARWVERASEACKRAVDLNEDLAAGHVCLGTVALGTGRYGEATTAFGWAMSRDPTSDEAYRGLARTFERLGRPDAAEEVYRKAVADRPHYWAAYNWLGAFYFRQGRPEEAQETLNEVVALAPTSYRGYQNQGGVYLLRGRYADAIEALEISVLLKPTARGYSNLASAYFMQGKFAPAAHYNEEAIGLDQNDYAIWGNLAEAYYWLPGSRDKSREPYRRAIELAELQLEVNPNAPETLGELAKYHAMLGDRDEALEYIRKAKVLGSWQGHEGGRLGADLAYNAAIVYTQIGEFGAALDSLEYSRARGMQRIWIRDNPVFAELREEARFQELIQ